MTRTEWGPAFEAFQEISYWKRMRAMSETTKDGTPNPNPESEAPSQDPEETTPTQDEAASVDAETASRASTPNVSGDGSR